MRNFDEARAERAARPRSFQLGGETFTYIIGMRPEEYAEAIKDYSEMLTETAAQLQARANGEPRRATTNTESIRIMDQTIKNFLIDDENRTRYDRLRQRKKDPVTGFDIGEVVGFLIAEQMGRRPTEAPDSSTSGRDTTGETSTESSSGVPEAVVVSEA